MQHFIPYRKHISYSVFSALFLLLSTLVGAQTWTGNVSTDWAVAGNWSTNSLPSNTANVIIPANPTGGRMPVHSSGTDVIGSLTIEAGAIFQQTGGILQIKTAITNDGIYDGTSGTLELLGSSITISGTAEASFPVVAVTAGTTVTMNNSNRCLALEFLYASPSSTFKHANNASLTVDGDVTIITFPKNNTTKVWDIGAGSATVKGNLKIGSGQESNASGRFAKVILTTGTLTVNGNLLFNANAGQAGNAVLDLSGGAATVNIGGTMSLVNNTGTITPGTLGSTVNFNGIAAQSILFTSLLRYNNIAINNPAGVTPAAAITTTLVTGNILVQSGVFNNGGFAIAGNSAKSFQVSNGATFNMSAGGMVTGFGTRSFGASSTVSYSGAAQTVSAEAYGNLTLSGSGVKTMPSSAMTLAGDFTTAGTVSATAANILTIQGSVTLGAGTTFNGGTFVHNLAGNWTNNGATFTPSTGTFNFNGSGSQTIGGTSAASFYRLTVNKAAGDVQLSTNLTVTNLLTFTKGTIKTNAFTVIIPSGSSVSGGGATTGWVNGNLQKYFSATSGGTFEIGSTYYEPASVVFAAVTTAGSLIASPIAGVHPNIATATIKDNKVSTGWKLSTPSTGAIVYTSLTLTVNWNAANSYANLNTANLMVARFASGAWSYPTSNTPTTTSLKGTGITTLGDFTVGQACAANFRYSASGFCTNGGAATPIINAGATAGTFTASPQGLSINASTGAITPGSSAAGSYTITNSITGTCATSATTTVAITVMPNATITYSGSPFCNSGTAMPTLSGTAGGTYSSTAGLSITASTGAINLGATTPATYTVTYTIAASGGCPSFQTTSAPVAIGPAIWVGNTDTSWANTLNWSCNATPTSADNVIIPTGRPNKPVIVGNQTNFAKDLTIEAGTSVVVNGAILKISGTIYNNGFIDAQNGATIEFNGTSAQVIPAGAFANNTVFNLTNNNLAGTTLQGPLDITNILSLTAGTLYTNGFLTLKSTANNTARVDQIKSVAAQPIVGDVTVERYVPGRRKYRLITPSVTTSNNAKLAPGEEDLSIWAHWQNGGNNTVSNLGTLITGGTAADGFDTQTSSASLYTYNETTRRFVAFNSASGQKTKYTPLQAGRAYYMFVYGDRKNAINALNPNPTVLKAKGTLATGTQAFTTTSAVPLSNTVGNFSLIGNPYACMIDWKNVTKTNVSNTIWSWDANLNSTGGYVTVTATAGGAIVSPISALVMASRFVQPGQGFFVQTTAANPQVVFTENNKINIAANINSMVFRTAEPTAQPLMAVNLIFNSGGSPVLADGAVVSFDAANAKTVGEDDALKMANSAEVVALNEQGTLLAIDGRPMPQSNDTLAIHLGKLTKAQYTLEIFGQDLDSKTPIPLLQDTYLNTVQPLSLTDTNRVVFNVSAADPASSSASRFRIVFSQMNALPVTFTSVAATKKEAQVLVEWKVSNEDGIKRYEVERAVDGVSFVKTAEIAARINAHSEKAYQWIDVTPAMGNNWYRIRSIESNNTNHGYSKTVAVVMNTSHSSVAVAPNPVKNQQINLHFRNVAAGRLNAFLYNQTGIEIWKTTIDQNGGNSSLQLPLATKLPRGIYYLRLTNGTERYILEIMIE